MDPVTSSDPIVRLLGYVAGTITTLAFVPQVIRSLRTRSTGDLSRAWLGSFITGVTLWLVYGLLLREPPIVLANAFTLALSLVLLWVRLRGGTPRR
jgi:MtN3 and saliva related transmembrane protein